MELWPVRLVIYAEGFALTRSLYRFIRRQVRRRLDGLCPPTGRAVISIGSVSRDGRVCARCRLELVFSGRPALATEWLADDVPTAFTECLEALAAWMPNPP
ncbi:MAG: hypothetical protein PVH31_10370 [Ectothiorhodospiraceae bacterium]|jgi:hypothetical protein